MTFKSFKEVLKLMWRYWWISIFLPFMLILALIYVLLDMLFWSLRNTFFDIFYSGSKEINR